MKQFYNRRFDFKKESVVTPEFIEIRGRKSLLLDGYCRITDYSDIRIELCTDNYCVVVTGRGLTLRHLSMGKLAIDGRIDNIGFLPSDKISVR